jgi:hypothetical protein
MIDGGVVESGPALQPAGLAIRRKKGSSNGKTIALNRR